MFIRDNMPANPEHISGSEIEMRDGEVLLRIKINPLIQNKIMNVGEDVLLKEYGLLFAKRISEIASLA